MNRKYLYKLVLQYIELYPTLKGEILDLWDFANNQIIDGEDETTECQLAINEIESIIKKINSITQ